MARNSSNKKNKIRLIERDLVYTETSIAKLINNFMLNGEKQKAAKIVYTALNLVHKALPELTVQKIMNTALTHLSPSKKATKRVIRGRTLQIPQDINAHQQANQASKILVKCTRNLRKKKGIQTFEALASVIYDSYNNVGEAVDYKKSMESAAAENRAYKI